MIPSIVRHLERLTSKNSPPYLVINEHQHRFDESNFKSLVLSTSGDESIKGQYCQSSPPLIFVDGGSAIITETASFSLSLIRLCAIEFQHLRKTSLLREEFYLLTTPTVSQVVPLKVPHRNLPIGNSPLAEKEYFNINTPEAKNQISSQSSSENQPSNLSFSADQPLNGISSANSHSVTYISTIFPLMQHPSAFPGFRSAADTGLHQHPLPGNNSHIPEEHHLTISRNHPCIRPSKYHARPSRIVDIARRFGELSMAAKSFFSGNTLSSGSSTQRAEYTAQYNPAGGHQTSNQAGKYVGSTSIFSPIVVIDGLLDATYPHEEIYLSRLPPTACSLAKSTSQITTVGLSADQFLLKNGPENPWIYSLSPREHFVKLHRSSRHVLRFQGSSELASFLLIHCSDAIFPGYPYGLIHADQLARISNTEKKALTLRFLNHPHTRKLRPILDIPDAHSILDSIS